MTSAFRIEAVHLDTLAGPVTYSFPGDLTVLAGPTAVGKTSLLELIKYGLGGDGRLAPVARESVNSVRVEIRAGEERFGIERRLDPRSSKTVKVWDSITKERLKDHSVAGKEPLIGDLLLGAMGLPVGTRAAARGGKSSRAGQLVTFNDLLRFMYIPQREMNRSIAGSGESYYEPKRKAVFEILFQLTDEEILAKRSEANGLRGLVEAAKVEARVVDQFLSSTGVESRLQAEQRKAEADSAAIGARNQGALIRSDLSEALDRRTLNLRDLLAEAEAGLADARTLRSELERQRQEYVLERDRVLQDIERLDRMESAGERLASIEFVVCPRCTQRLDQREVPAEACRLCLQLDVVPDPVGRNQYESTQLRAQMQEIEAQLVVTATETANVAAAVEGRTSLVRSLSAEIDGRTSERVTPRLQQFADAAAEAARYGAESELMERVLRQWDRADDLQGYALSLETKRERLIRDVEYLESTLAARRAEVFAELDAEFQSTVRAFGIPSVQSANIDATSYLPVLNGRPYDEASAGGGIISATQVAYWLTLVTVAARRRDTLVPTFLLLDSPRLALNAEEDIAAHMYRRFATQVQVAPGRLQFIIADNELPVGEEDSIVSISFSYDQPTISTISHPGLEGVEALDSEI